MSEISLRSWPWSGSRRVLLLAIIVSALLLIGFYSVTDSARLAHDHVLDGADIIGYSICHRITERSFTVAGRQLPLCARCTGMYLGLSLTFVILLLAGRRRWSNLPPMKITVVLIAFIALMGIDGVNSYSHFFPNLPHLYEPQNWLRLVTGMGAGLAMGAILFPALSQTLWLEQKFRSPIGNYRELGGVVLIAAIASLLVLSNQPTILYVLGIVSAAGVVIALTAINTTALLIIFKRDARSATWKQALLALSIGLVFAVTQIGIVSYLRFSLTGTMTGLPGL